MGNMQAGGGYGDPYGGGYGDPYAGGYGDPYAEGYGDPYAEGYGDPYGAGYGDPYGGGYGYEGGYMDSGYSPFRPEPIVLPPVYVGRQQRRKQCMPCADPCAAMPRADPFAFNQASYGRMSLSSGMNQCNMGGYSSGMALGLSAMGGKRCGCSQGGMGGGIGGMGGGYGGVGCRAKVSLSNTGGCSACGFKGAGSGMACGMGGMRIGFGGTGAFYV